MKNLLVFGLFIIMLVFVQFAQAQTVDEIIDKHIEAIGGKEKLMALKTIKMDGNMSVQGFEVGIVNTTAHAIGNRTDISVPGMGEGYQIMTPTKGWSYMPFQGQTSPEEVSEEQVKSGQGSLDIQGSLLNYKEKGNTVELLGKEKAEGADCYKIKLTTKSGKVNTVFINATTYYRVKAITTRQVNGSDADEEATYGDFKKTPEGYVFPYSVTTSRGTLIFSTIEVNKPVDENIFKSN